MREREAGWICGLSPAEIAEIETAVRARGLDIATIRDEDFPLRSSGQRWTGCEPRCSHRLGATVSQGASAHARGHLSARRPLSPVQRCLRARSLADDATIIADRDAAVAEADEVNMLRLKMALIQ
jgi:hypothetical protein